MVWILRWAGMMARSSRMRGQLPRPTAIVARAPTVCAAFCLPQPRRGRRPVTSVVADGAMAGYPAGRRSGMLYRAAVCLGAGCRLDAPRGGLVAAPTAGRWRAR